MLPGLPHVTSVGAPTRGVVPEILDEHPAATIRDDDPTWRFALARLGEIIAESS